ALARPAGPVWRVWRVCGFPFLGLSDGRNRPPGVALRSERQRLSASRRQGLLLAVWGAGARGRVPGMIAVHLLPAEIRASRRAVVWKREFRDGKATKVPYIPHCPDQRAAVDDPATRGSFDAALAAVVAGKADGAGIVLGDGVVGVDVDDCRDPET